MSGELRAEAEWAPTDPVQAKPKRRRQRRPPPATHRGVILHGLRRLVLVLIGSAGAVAGIAEIVVWRGGGSPAHVFPLAYYFAGAGVGALAVLGGTGVGGTYRHSGRSNREVAFNTSFFFAFLATFLFGVGLTLDYLL
ncbi:MAG: hypothetical protein QOG06_2766 [Gaiellaceae bacterium]|jgi:hypothetical protein|nr:hypothetical protein [Gaiellaceae bacterium]